MAAASEQVHDADSKSPILPPNLEVGEIAASCLAAPDRDLILLARDELRAAEIHAAIAAGAPDALVLLCPGSDALPGDAVPASPSNVGLRASALRRTRAELAIKRRRRVVLVSPGEAAACLFSVVLMFEAALLLVRT